MTLINTDLLPRNVKDFVEQQVHDGPFRDEDEYVLSLIEADRRKNLRSQLEAQLLEGLNSPRSPFTDEDFAEIRRLGLEQIALKKNK